MLLLSSGEERLVWSLLCVIRQSVSIFFLSAYDVQHETQKRFYRKANTFSVGLFYLTLTWTSWQWMKQSALSLLHQTERQADLNT